MVWQQQQTHGTEGRKNRRHEKQSHHEETAEEAPVSISTPCSLDLLKDERERHCSGGRKWTGLIFAASSQRNVSPNTVLEVHDVSRTRTVDYQFRRDDGRSFQSVQSKATKDLCIRDLTMARAPSCSVGWPARLRPLRRSVSVSNNIKISSARFLELVVPLCYSLAGHQHRLCPP